MNLLGRILVGRLARRVSTVALVVMVLVLIALALYQGEQVPSVLR